MKDQDSIFFKNFSYLLGFLVLLTIVLAVYASHKHDELVNNEDRAKDRTEVETTLAPVAKVNTSGEVMAKVEVAETVEAAFGGSTDGKMIYDNVCSACHSTGAGGAPKLEVAAWAGRSEKGLEALVQQAITGFSGASGYMPAKGGRADLNDEQITATVQFMLDSLQ
jgi:cytochrome c5